VHHEAGQHRSLAGWRLAEEQAVEADALVEHLGGVVRRVEVQVGRRTWGGKRCGVAGFEQGYGQRSGFGVWTGCRVWARVQVKVCWVRVSGLVDGVLAVQFAED
jgi:hypothetical protein